jgi:hypothetical protein
MFRTRQQGRGQLQQPFKQSCNSKLLHKILEQLATVLQTTPRQSPTYRLQLAEHIFQQERISRHLLKMLFAESFWGIGQIKDAAGNLRAPFLSAPNAPPSSTGNQGSILTAFNGDLTKCQFPVEHSITGSLTAGQPTTGYQYTPEIYPHYTYLYNTSGWNQNTDSNIGRTAVCAYRTKVDNYGQGDAMAYNATAFVTGTKTGSTNFLANPAGALFGGDMNAGADGVYLNIYETIASDYKSGSMIGYDVACFGIVNNFNRTNATGAKSAVWGAYRAQNIGTAACDAMISATGLWQTGLDFAMSTLDFGSNQAAISLRSGQRIYLNNAAGASGNLNANYRTTRRQSSWRTHRSHAITQFPDILS